MVHPLMEEHEPRPQHYDFAHRLLPREVFAAPDRVFSILESTVALQELLLPLWQEAGGTLPPDGLRVSVRQELGSGWRVALVHLPPPQRATEAHFAAVAYRPSRTRLLILKEPVELRYFVLERAADADERVRAHVAEWRADGTRHRLGPVADASEDGFIDAIAASVLDA